MRSSFLEQNAFQVVNQNPYVSYVDPEEVFNQAVKMLALDSATNTISMLCVSRIQE